MAYSQREKFRHTECRVRERLLDLICEKAGRRIYEAQQLRLGDQGCLAAKRPWRSPDVPVEFWDGYCADARAALSVNQQNPFDDRPSVPRYKHDQEAQGEQSWSS